MNRDLFSKLGLTVVRGTEWVGQLCAMPIKFLGSPSYRRQLTRESASAPGRVMLELIAGTVLVTSLASALAGACLISFTLWNESHAAGARKSPEPLDEMITEEIDR